MKTSCCLLAFLAVHGAAVAQQAPRVVRPFVSLAFTAGGDTLATARYIDGSTSSIKAGGQTYFKGGLDFHVASPFSLQASFGMHTDSTKEAKNGSMDFKRNTVEGMAYWHPGPHSRLGLGVRKVSNPRVTGSGVAGSDRLDFNASTGSVVEWEYLSGPFTSFGSRAGFSVRYVNEKYTPSQLNGLAVTGPAVDGNHFGLAFSWYF